MANATTRLTNDALAFLTERHLAMLTTLRSDNSPHVVAVGFTFDPKTHIARVITTGGSQKAVNAEQRGVAVLSQVDGARWLSLEGSADGQHRPRRGPRRRTALRPALPHAAGQPAAGGHRGADRAGAGLVGPAGPRPTDTSGRARHRNHDQLVRPLVDRLAPSAVTMTMSSMRAPHSPGK